MKSDSTSLMFSHTFFHPEDITHCANQRKNAKIQEGKGQTTVSLESSLEIKELSNDLIYVSAAKVEQKRRRKKKENVNQFLPPSQSDLNKEIEESLKELEESVGKDPLGLSKEW